VKQGLQVAAVSLLGEPLVVPTDDISICSPFWPKQPAAGDCGAHFVGLNARHLPWNYHGRAADEWMRDHWQYHRQTLYEKAGIAMPQASSERTSA
jgi:hypothetical protein